MKPAFQFIFRVRYPECDAQQVVFNARYGDYADLAVSEFWRATFGSYSQLVDMGFETQVVSLLIEWKSSARFDDVLQATVRPLRFGNTSMSLEVDFHHRDEQRFIAKATVVYVLVDAATFQKAQISEDLKLKVQNAALGRRVDQSGPLE